MKTFDYNMVDADMHYIYESQNTDVYTKITNSNYHTDKYFFLFFFLYKDLSSLARSETVHHVNLSC